LSGVMAVGDVPTYIAENGALPGRRALVAGTGLLLLDAARRLSEAGVEVVCVLEAGTPPWSDGTFTGDSAAPEPMRGAADAWERLNCVGIPIVFQHTIFTAHGGDAVSGATYGPVDPEDWRPLKERSKTMEVDLVVVGFGDVARDELAVLAGCRQQYDQTKCGWVPARDPLMRTTVPGIFAVGDGAGVAGHLVAVEEGRVAGITAAEQAGAISPGEAAARRAGPLGRLPALVAARAALDEASRIRPGLLELAEPDTILCRCEGVTLAALRSAVAEGFRELSSVKLLTRLGMGPCQGKECGPAAGMHLCRATQGTPEEVGRINPRPPVRPVTLGALARMAGVPMSTLVDPRDAVGGGAT
jgi:hypothetical protein